MHINWFNERTNLRERERKTCWRKASNKIVSVVRLIQFSSVEWSGVLERTRNGRELACSYYMLAHSRTHSLPLLLFRFLLLCVQFNFNFSCSLLGVGAVGRSVGPCVCVCVGVCFRFGLRLFLYRFCMNDVNLPLYNQSWFPFIYLALMQLLLLQRLWLQLGFILNAFIPLKPSHFVVFFLHLLFIWI